MAIVFSGFVLLGHVWDSSLWAKCLVVFLSVPPLLYFALFISVTGAWRLMARLSGLCQPLLQSPSWSWLPVVEAPGCLRHPTST